MVRGAPARSAGAHPGSSPAGESFEVLLWRAGRPIPPGVPAGREAEIASDSALALQELEGALLSARSRAAPRLRAILEGDGTTDELWCCAAHVAAALERYELAPLLGAALDPLARTRRSLAASEALHALYGRWFADESELDPYLRDIDAGEDTRLLLRSLQWEEARSRERLLAELSHAPSSAAAWLGDPDPLVRSGAARCLGEVFARANEDPSGTLDLLLSHLEREQDPRAFHEALLAALQPLEQADPDHPALQRLRELLAQVAASSGDARSLSVAVAIARLPWRREGTRDGGHVLSGVEFLAQMLVGLAEADRLRGANDPDPMVVVFGALRSLCDQAGAAGLSQELRSSGARSSVLGILQDGHEDEAVRATAGSALGPLALPSDWPCLAAVLSDPAAAPSVKHALLGSLRTILTGFQPGDPGSDELLGSIAALAAAPDSDLRRRALVLLADPHLESLVRRLDPSFLVLRLIQEENPDVSSELLGLIQRFGRADMLGPLLSAPRFDDLASDPSRLDDLAAALRALAGSSARASMTAAARLASVHSQATGLACLRHALSLVAQLDDASALELYPAEHSSISAWAWRIFRSGVAPRETVPQGIAFERRLLEVHLPRGEKATPAGSETSEFGAFERAHLSAVLRADLVLAGIGRITKPQVEGAFELAYDLAPAPELGNLVLRDRARFRAAANECVKALADYRRILETDSGENGLLGLPDLRTAVELLERIGGSGAPGREATAADACDLLERIVQCRAWRAEAASVRMQDVRDLAGAAVDSRDRSRLRRLEAALADLPLTQVELEAIPEPLPVWFGLLREPAWFQELLDLRARVRIELRDLEAEG